MADLIAAVLGWSVLLLAIVAVCAATVRRARLHGLMAPLLIGFGLRLVVMSIAHVGSLSLGDHGLLVVDDRTYLNGGSIVAELLRGGHTPDISQPHILGTYQFGYQVFLGTVFTLGTTSVLLGKLLNVLFGAITVVLVGILGGRLLGEGAKLRAAWIAALAPSLVWWSAPLLKEALATMLMVLGLLAITYLPRPRAIALLGAVLAVFLILRGPAAFALLAGAIVAVAVAGRQTERRWLSRPLVTFVAVVLAGMVGVAVIVSRGNLARVYNQYDFVVHNMIGQYRGGNPARLPYDAVKSLVTPLPWVFDRNTENWDRGLFPGVWLLMCALPLAALGAWRLRRRPEAWAILGTAATALSINSFTSGFVFRQRSMIEPVVLLLALGGARSWQMAARSAAATLVLVAAVAGVQSRSPLVVASILAAAAALALASRRLPARAFEPLPESPMVASFRRSLEARAGGRGAGLPATVRAAGAATRAWLFRSAPRLDPLRWRVAADGPGTVFEPGQARVRPALARLMPRFDAPGMRTSALVSWGGRIRLAAATLGPTVPRLEGPGAGSAAFERRRTRVRAGVAALARWGARLQAGAERVAPRLVDPGHQRAEALAASLLRARSVAVRAAPRLDAGAVPSRVQHPPRLSRAAGSLAALKRMAPPAEEPVPTRVPRHD